MSPFEPLADKSLADRAYEIIRDAILKMTLKPGETLVEAKLASALGISKTPIRQALHRLEQTGLVTGVPNKGYTVSRLTLRDAYEILDIRSALEGLAAERAIARITDADLAELARLLEEARAAYEAGNREECAELGHRFHGIVLERADNQRLSHLISVLNDQFHRVRLLSSQIPGRLPRSMEEHQRLFDALKARDARRAAKLMREHLHAVYEEVERDDALERDEAFDSRPSAVLSARDATRRERNDNAAR